MELHPQAAESYTREVMLLREVLRDGVEDCEEARQVLRSLITEIRISPLEKRGQHDLTIVGDLPAFPEKPGMEMTTVLVAGGVQQSPT